MEALRIAPFACAVHALRVGVEYFTGEFPEAAGAASFLRSAAQMDQFPAYASQFLYEAMRAGAAPADVAAQHAALLTVADEFTAIGAQTYAVEAAVDAAAAFLRQGRDDSARRAAARAPREADRRARRARVDQRGHRHQLVLSVRTVERHLYRAMRKLGVSDRREL